MSARFALGLATLLAGAPPVLGQVPGAAPPASTPQPQAPAAAVVPTPAVLEKLAQGDRAFAAGELRAALFAYQDAVYAQPSYLHSRVKLGRTYLAMRYPDFAGAQAETVLRADPGNPDALLLLDEARKAPPRSAAATATAAAGGAAASGEPRPPPRTYKLPPAAEGAPAATAPAVAGAVAAGAASATPAPGGQTAAQRYKAGVQLINQREYAGAVTELTEAITLDPRLAVAYAARASARFGLGKYREAADDYKAALGLDPGLATPLYGLAECYRQIGDPAAAEMYQRYADSKAPDVREDLRAVAARKARELGGK